MSKRSPEIAYEVIKKQITTGELAPAQRLVEEKLARSLSLSRHNVRIALQRLQTDGLVDIEPNRGATVATMTLEQAMDTLEARKILEIEVTRAAAANVTDDELALLKTLVEKMERAISEKEFDEYSQTNRVFHGKIYEIARRPTIGWLIGLLRERMSRLQMRTILIPGRSSESLHEHTLIFEALKAHDGDAAAAAAERHITSLGLIIQEAWGLVRS